MHAFANPARFLKLARPATAWLLGLGIVLAVAGIGGGLFVTPPDYLQGETVRILYVHVPAAWLGMAGWGAIAAASISQIVWRHPLAAVAGRALGVPTEREHGRDQRRVDQEIEERRAGHRQQQHRGNQPRQQLHYPAPVAECRNRI